MIISKKARILELILKFVKFRSLVAWQIKNPSRSKQLTLPKNLERKFNFRYFEVLGKTHITLSKQKKQESHRHIIFFHGGSYVFEMSNLHWNLVEKILDNLDVKVTVIDYPLTPEHDYKETCEVAEVTYELLSKDYPDDKFILFGDSAGGGLALGLNQKISISNKFKKPSKLVLISPWLNLELDRKEITEMQKLDPILSIKYLEYAAKSYSNGDNLKSYLLSPINVDMRNIPNTLMLYSDKELFYPDFVEFRKNIKSINSKIRFIKFDSMLHDWVLFPIPEADKALSIVYDFINN